MNETWLAVAVMVVAAIAVGGVVGYVLVTQDDNDVATQNLLLATTTSTYDSGLLDYILPEFEEKYNCEIDVIAVGSGAAMELGKNGDVDVLLVHSPAAEQTFVADGYGEGRNLVMYNNYILVGSLSDPADTNHSGNVTIAFNKIYDNGTAGDVKFLSRGDNSGTHNKELSIWKNLGLNTSNFDGWYVSTGLGMGDLLDMCEEEDATTPSYTLSDDATYYQRASESLIPHLGIAYNAQKTDPLLKNQYSVIVLNETRFPHINHTIATDFKDWMISDEGQDLIASYERYGQQLFFPNAPGYTPSAASVKDLTAPIDIDGQPEPVAAKALVAELRLGMSVRGAVW